MISRLLAKPHLSEEPPSTVAQIGKVYLAEATMTLGYVFQNDIEFSMVNNDGSAWLFLVDCLSTMENC